MTNVNFLGLASTAQFSHNNSATQIDLITDDGEPLATATVNIGDLPENLVAIKTYSENEGIDQSLINAGLIEAECAGFVENGFVAIPVHALTREAIALRDNAL